MSKKLKDLCLSAFIVLNIFALGFIGGYKASDHFRDQAEKVVDTLVINHWDTIKIDQPVEIVRTIIRHDTTRVTEFVSITDSALIEKLDSLDLHIEIPIEQAIYRDSTKNARYEAYVSGYKASLDSINIQCLQSEKIIMKTERIPPRRIGFGLQIGFGYSGKVAPYVGVGVQYRLW